MCDEQSFAFLTSPPAVSPSATHPPRPADRPSSPSLLVHPPSGSRSRESHSPSHTTPPEAPLHFSTAPGCGRTPARRHPACSSPRPYTSPKSLDAATHPPSTL